jgi:CheY-like chemotaxis protein
VTRGRREPPSRFANTAFSEPPPRRTLEVVERVDFDTRDIAVDLERIRVRLAQARMLGRTDLGAATERARLAAGAKPIRLLYADDDERYRLLLGTVLRTYPQFEVVGVAEDGEEAVELALAEQPDVVLLDIEMPRLGGLEAAERIAAELPSTQIVLHTGELHETRRSEVVALGLPLVDKLAIHETLQQLV